ncbi:MAG: class II aldolase/adducin family protein [Tissierellia bacterium]|nr:class II aldolase/adducin family protein [Tissierellia bacterium]
MKNSIEEAKKDVIKAGKILVENGLIARTWGNVSARISDEQFVITPSGLAYETLIPEQIVIVNIADCSYNGNIKPSSEKGIHADTYKLRPEVNFIIHTHQLMASVISIEGKSINIENNEYREILGEVIPCTDYGMSSTKKLRKKVSEAVSNYPDSKAFIMKNHGTICMGYNLKNTFDVATILEKIAEEKYKSTIKENESHPIADYGNSFRQGNKFTITISGKTAEYSIDGVFEDMPKEVQLHAEIYKKNNISNILHATDDVIVEFSRTGRILKPLLDDLVQIAGINIQTTKSSNISGIAKMLKKKNAIFLEKEGALCTGVTKADAEAVVMVLRKGCLADFYSSARKLTDQLGLIDSYIQRIVYKNKYSKIKDNGAGAAYVEKIDRR